MTETKEGYLICQNVKIGRTGAMDYLGSELPDEFNENPTRVCSVRRNPEELFSPETIESFEGKSVTNTHPSDNLNLDTVKFVECGHMQNVHKDSTGKYLIADLFIKDSGLINEIKENIKREVSCGYDCSWVKIGDGQYEQREIRGNHVAVVKAGRAGHKVAIQDSIPDNKNIKKHGGKVMGKNILDKILGLGFQKFAEDAEPEEVSAAMKAMHGDDKKVHDDDDDVKDKNKAKDEEYVEEEKKEKQAYEELANEVKELKDMIAKIVEHKAEKKTTDAKTIMDALEKEVGCKKAADDDDDNDDEEEEEEKVADDDDDKEKAQDDKKIKGKAHNDDDDDDEEEEEEEENKKAADSAIFAKIVQDMKPVIMAIKDEKERTKAAKRFAKAVKDAKSTSNSYGVIMATANKNRVKAAQDSSSQQMSIAQRSINAVEALAKAGESMKVQKY